MVALSNFASNGAHSAKERLRGAGVFLAAVNADFHGMARSATTPTIGADENAALTMPAAYDIFSPVMLFFVEY